MNLADSEEAVIGFSAMILAKPLCDNHSVGYGATPSHTINYISAHKLDRRGFGLTLFYVRV